ncbi:hypothetical protein F4776DRAFT_660689 [Hypoxylon sp. NC0597]|nr:hypothetical protein F4776DRAFT_660689 [Hypoxylon sp. NC0597]
MNRKAGPDGIAATRDNETGDSSVKAPLTDGERKACCRWRCPYSLVFSHMLESLKFKSCGPPGSLNSRSLWKAHMKDYHSPEATSPSNFRLRPRPYDEWFEVQKKCFLEVWHILFPKELYPTLNEPLSPFHLGSSSRADINSRIGILLEAVCDANAEQAVSTSSSATVKDFHPLNEQQMTIMKDAFAIAMNMSPSASHWLANMSPEGLRAAVAGHNQTTLGAKVENADSKSANSPEPSPHPGSESSPMNGPTGPSKVTSIALSSWGTHISIETSPPEIPATSDPAPRPTAPAALPPAESSSSQLSMDYTLENPQWSFGMNPNGLEGFDSVGGSDDLFNFNSAG